MIIVLFIGTDCISVRVVTSRFVLSIVRVVFILALAAVSRTVCLALWLGQLMLTRMRKWLSRVLGSGQAFLRLTGPRAVRMRNGWFSGWRRLSIAILFLRTVRSSVDRAWGSVWPTLLVTSSRANIGFLTKWKVCALLGCTLSILVFRTLVGTRLGANRTCVEVRFSIADSALISTAPFKLGRFISSVRLFDRTVVSVRLMMVRRFMNCCLMSVWVVIRCLVSVCILEMSPLLVVTIMFLPRFRRYFTERNGKVLLLTVEEMGNLVLFMVLGVDSVEAVWSVGCCGLLLAYSRDLLPRGDTDSATSFDGCRTYDGCLTVWFETAWSPVLTSKCEGDCHPSAMFAEKSGTCAEDVFPAVADVDTGLDVTKSIMNAGDAAIVGFDYLTCAEDCDGVLCFHAYAWCGSDVSTDCKIPHCSAEVVELGLDGGSASCLGGVAPLSGVRTVCPVVNSIPSPIESLTSDCPVVV